MKIAFDCDGVLANFNQAYYQLVVNMSGINLFHPGDEDNPPCWNYPEYRGYSKEVVAAVWAHITTNPMFWLNLEPIEENTSALRSVLRDLERKHDIYFVTSRPGERAKRQSEIWLFDHLAYPMRAPGVYPTVLIAGMNAKGDIAKSLKLDCYIDDNFDNVQDVAAKSPATRTYLLTRRYNEIPLLSDLVTRVDTLGEMLDHEINNL